MEQNSCGSEFFIIYLFIFTEKDGHAADTTSGGCNCTTPGITLLQTYVQMVGQPRISAPNPTVSHVVEKETDPEIVSPPRLSPL